MKLVKFLVIAFALLCCNKEEPKVYNKIHIKDDIGNIISFDKPPERIITLAPSLTETIYSLGLEKKLVGNTIYCDYPEDAKRKEKVGDLLNVDFEKIVALKPDIIFITVEGNTKETYNKLKELGLKVYVSNPRNIESIKRNYLNVAEIFGKKEFAENQIRQWDSVLTNISKKLVNIERKSAMYIVELKPIMLAGKNTFINEYMNLCGLKNIADDASLNYPVFSREEILKRNPDYIVIPEGRNSTLEKILKIYPEWRNLNAIKNNKIIAVDRNNFSRPGPRYIEAINELFTLLHHQQRGSR